MSKVEINIDESNNNNIRKRYDRKQNILRQGLELLSGIRQRQHASPDGCLREENMPEPVDADFIDDLKYFKMKEYKSRNKQETKVFAKVCYHNGFRSMQLKSIIDNRKGNLMSIPNSVLSYEIRQHQNDDSCFDPITYIQQMGKDEFLSFLRHRVAKVGDILLSQINQTTNDCPYIKKWFTYYSQKSVEDIVQAISKFEPLTQVAPSFDEYIDLLVSRVQSGLQKNIDTGTIEDIPNEIRTGKERPEIFKHIQERISPTVQLSRCCTNIEEEHFEKEHFKDLSKMMCWNAVGYFITKDNRFLEKADCKKVIEDNATTILTESSQIPSGLIIGFFYGDTLIHAMYSSGNKKAKGNKNSCVLESGHDVGWEELPLPETNGNGEFTDSQGRTIIIKYGQWPNQYILE